MVAERSGPDDSAMMPQSQKTPAFHAPSFVSFVIFVVKKRIKPRRTRRKKMESVKGMKGVKGVKGMKGLRYSFSSLRRTYCRIPPWR